MKHLVIVERTETGYSAFLPDLGGCVAVGSTRDEVERNVREAVEFHVDGLRQDGFAVPMPTTYSTYVEITD